MKLKEGGFTVNKNQLELFVDDYSKLMQSITISLQAIQKELFKDSRITPDQFNLMDVVNKRKSCTSTVLANIFNVKKSSITAIINRLVEKGLIKRVFNEKDRRLHFLELTDEGQGILREEREKILELLLPIGDKLSDKELDDLKLHLSKIENQLDIIKKGMNKNEN